MKIPSYNKYSNTKVIVDGITFASKREMQRYTELKLLARAGKITELILQPKYELQPAFVQGGKKYRAITYIADFRYVDREKGQCVVEDCKGVRTKEYVLKAKLFLCQNPEIIFREI